MADPGADLDLGRPRDVGSLLSTALALYRRHFVIFAATALLVVAVIDVLLLGLGVGVLTSGPAADRGVWWAVAATLAPALVATPLITAMHVRIVQGIAARNLPSVGEAVFAGLAVFPVVAAVVIVSTAGVVIGAFLLLIPGLYLLTIWAVGAQAAVVEEPGSPVAALTRSHRLVRGQWWRVFGIVLLLGVIGELAASAISWPLALVAAATGSGVLALSSAIAGDAVSLSFVALSGTLLFFDLVAREARRTN